MTQLSTLDSILLKHATRTRGSHPFAAIAGKNFGFCSICNVDFTPTGKEFKEPSFALPCITCGITGQCGAICDFVVFSTSAEREYEDFLKHWE